MSEAERKSERETLISVMGQKLDRILENPSNIERVQLDPSSLSDGLDERGLLDLQSNEKEWDDFHDLLEEKLQLGEDRVIVSTGHLDSEDTYGNFEAVKTGIEGVVLCIVDTYPRHEGGDEEHREYFLIGSSGGYPV